MAGSGLYQGGSTRLLSVNGGLPPSPLAGTVPDGNPLSHGVTGQYFYQKNVPAGAPEWVKTKKRRETEYVVADSLSTLIWLANSNAVEFHLSLDRTEGVGVPNFAVLDLDPTAPAGFGEAVEVAKHLRELLEKLRLRGYPKLSGASGLHIYIPLKAEYDFTANRG